jgi:hypothetical protein
MNSSQSLHSAHFYHDLDSKFVMNPLQLFGIQNRLPGAWRSEVEKEVRQKKPQNTANACKK